MKIYTDIVQGTDEWFSLRDGKLSSSRVKGVLFDKVINKTDVINYLIEQKETQIKSDYENAVAKAKDVDVPPLEEKDLKKMIMTYKKELTTKSQR